MLPIVYEVQQMARPDPRLAADDPRPELSSGFFVQNFWPLAHPIMSRVVRSTVKRLAQKLVGESDVRGFVRKQKLWLSKKIYRQPVSIADLRQRLIDLGVTPGRTLWVQSSWNEFYNVPSAPERNDRAAARPARPRRDARDAGISDRPESRQGFPGRQGAGLYRPVVRSLSPQSRYAQEHPPLLLGMRDRPQCGFSGQGPPPRPRCPGARTARSAGWPNWTRECSASAPDSSS